MKRNILTIIILALSILNMVLTAIIVFSVVPNVKKTNNLIDQVAKIINLDLEAQNGNEKVITAEELDNFDLSEELIINLKKDADSNKERYVVISKISLSLYKGTTNYGKAKEKIEAATSNIYDVIRKTFSDYSTDGAKANEETIKNLIKSTLNEKYGDDLVQDIAFGSMVYQ